MLFDELRGLAVGDTWLKLPAIYTRRVFAVLSSDFATQYAERILTPPYVSNISDTYHRDIDPVDSFVVLCSDGLPDLNSGMNIQQLADQWVTVVGQILDSVTSDDDMPNLSLCLLRDAIGGDDVDAVSRYLTLEMDDKWIDDISIVVQRFGPRNT
jgi:pyruvate dehydrogenase phosphatase